MLWTLGVRWHAITVLANATGHQFSCIFGSVLCFLGTASQHHHHPWGVRGNRVEPSCCNPGSLSCTLHWSWLLKKQWNGTENFWECITNTHRGTTNLHRGGGCRNPLCAVLQLPALLVHAELGTKVLQLLPPVRADTCACSPSSWTPAACSDVTARPFKTPLQSAVAHCFSSSLPFCVRCEWLWQKPEFSSSLWYSQRLLFSCGFLKCDWYWGKCPFLPSCYQMPWAATLWKSGKVLPALVL